MRKRAVILVGTDKGLCGALNSNLFREAARFDVHSTVFIAAGRKAAAVRGPHAARAGRRVHLQGHAAASARRGPSSSFARELFLKGEVDQVDILFTRFINTLTQRPVVIQFLPIGEIKGLRLDVAEAEAEPPEAANTSEFLFEPGPGQVLGALLPHYLNFYMYQVLLEAKASEQSARMVAMKNATDNAHQLIKDLTLEYNKIRQASITKELLEISSAAMAVA